MAMSYESAKSEHRGDRMSEHEMELGELVRKCRFCNQTFALQEDLLKHLKEAHGIEEESA
jgi:hypothetical protein